jgi:hypothetical protein
MTVPVAIVGDASVESRLLADIPKRATRLRADLPRYERDAAEATAQAKLRPNDAAAKSYAAEQVAALKRLRADLARAEAGEVDPEALAIARMVDARAVMDDADRAVAHAEQDAPGLEAAVECFIRSAA